MKSNIHGTFNSFESLAMAMGIKSRKTHVEHALKCGVCGSPMREIPGTNVWVCDTHKLSIESLPDGKEVQVFDKGGHFLLMA